MILIERAKKDLHALRRLVFTETIGGEEKKVFGARNKALHFLRGPRFQLASPIGISGPWHGVQFSAWSNRTVSPIARHAATSLRSCVTRAPSREDGPHHSTARLRVKS